MPTTTNAMSKLIIVILMLPVQIMLALLLVLAIAAILAMDSHVQTTMNVPVKLITAT